MLTSLRINNGSRSTTLVIDTDEAIDMAWFFRRFCIETNARNSDLLHLEFAEWLDKEHGFERTRFLTSFNV